MPGKRLDIQGLRALAVVLVVVFHLWPGRITGGYVGVDAFFVISGFLITAHLLSEVERTSTVSLSKFWARRVRRLLPAAFVVLGASLVAAFTILPRSLLEQTLVEIGASALYVQNWVLASNSVDYLAADNKPSIAQHFWSLSVEEQFYIFWPLLILAAIWAAAKWAKGRQSNRRVIAIALLAVFALSLAFSIYETSQSQASAYFITPTRAWEFAVGGLLVFVPAVKLSNIKLDSVVRVTLNWVGLGMVLYAAFTFDATTAFPGYLALIPVLGIALMLYTGESDSRWSPTYISSFSPIQLIGDLSYAIYLWHWPLIVLYPYVVGHELTFRGRVLILALTLVLAVLTKFLIEDPVRNAKGRFKLRRTSYAFMATGMAVLVGVSGCTMQGIDNARQDLAAQMALAIETGEGCFGASAMDPENNCEQPFAVTESVNPAFASEDSYWTLSPAALTYGIGPNDECPKRSGSTLVPCDFGSDNALITVALVGDSHAAHLLDPLLTYGEARGWNVELFTRSGCSSFELAAGGDTPNGDAVESAKCRQWASSVQQQLLDRTDIDVVVFSNLSTGYMMTAAQAVSIWDPLIESGKQVIAVRDVPGMPDRKDAPECVELSGDQYDPCSWQPDFSPDFITEAVALEDGRVPLVDLTEYFCDESGCHTVIGGVITYFDGSHLSFTYAKSLSPFFGAQIEEALAETGY